MREGDEDDAVIALRSALFSLGYYGKRYLKLRRFDKRLRLRVEAFQREFGLKPDGIVGPKTRGELVSAWSKTVNK
jgi:peptidoglycan hydrolase-like protein with peptidoglycan-binding domain